MIILLIITICLLAWLCFSVLPIKKKQINLISSNKKEDDLLLPIIDIEIAGIKTKAIIDTGSSLNIINKRFAMNNNLFVDYAKEKEVDSFLTAQGETSTDGVGKKPQYAESTLSFAPFITSCDILTLG